MRPGAHTCEPWKPGTPAITPDMHDCPGCQAECMVRLARCDADQILRACDVSGGTVCAESGCPSHLHLYGHWRSRQAGLCRACYDARVTARREAQAYRRKSSEFLRDHARICARIRAANFHNRREMARLAARVPVQPKSRYSGPPRKGYVYRLYAADGALLYIGKTYRVRARLLTGPSSHAVTKPWWPDVSRVEVAVYRTEADALEAEAHAIRRERPRHNVDAPEPKRPRSPRRLLRYSGEIA